jgi:Domain of unknown function (DUF4388)
MHGTLDTFSVVEVLQMLGRVRRSGTLHIECAERQIDVHFVQGRIAETRDSTRAYDDTVLGSLLVKRSLVSEAQLDQALREQETDPRPIGTILVERGFVAEDDLRDVLSRQVANTFLAVKTTAASGTFMFVTDDAAEPVDYITIDTQRVLIEVSSVGSDYVAAFELLGAANTVLTRNRDYESLPRHAVVMARDEFHVLALIDDERTVSEVAQASRLEEVTVISILGKFCQAKVLLTAGERPPTPAADSEFRAHRDSVRDEVSRIGDRPASPLAGPEFEFEPVSSYPSAPHEAAPHEAAPHEAAPLSSAPLDPAPYEITSPEPMLLESAPTEIVSPEPTPPEPAFIGAAPLDLAEPAASAAEPAAVTAEPAASAAEPAAVTAEPAAVTVTPAGAGAYEAPPPDLGVDGSGIDWVFDHLGDRPDEPRADDGASGDTRPAAADRDDVGGRRDVESDARVAGDEEPEGPVGDWHW